MAKNYVSNSKESVRMFKSDILESVSKVHFSVPLFIFIPVILYFGWKAIWQQELSPVEFSGYYLLGLFVWSLTEYVLHRFIFHLEPKKGNKTLERIHFVFHGVHHDYPSDAHRLVMPPSVSIPLAAAFYYLFSLFLRTGPLAAFFSAFMTGYLFYDMTHYALHHANFKNKFWKKLKKHHMLHHYDDASKGYGVSSPLWDKVFSSDFLKNKND
ncbi:sterol desaturase family protein [Dyadobacter frigoris]|uniref:Fatty acid hydroxylase n=1 Tax=Dyadobacter frigoris TaxID=2576211 RepID=A0A4U6D9D6_9BACT|nr:sterol desaturase family protein [Dyadobacter frigoris]TKT90844.1 fatty acid hydroxylase [Dyadobacter frigoris]GLU52180.1 fatty acid hydroxylase [Dyadobacter frigoris]